MRCEDCNNSTIGSPCRTNMDKNGVYKCPYDLDIPCSHEYEYKLYRTYPIRLYKKVCTKCGEIEK